MAEQNGNGLSRRGAVSFSSTQQNWEEDIWKAFEIDGGLSR